jgi:Lrp/AsnC family leucine-responsive transcriptional regulator
MDAKDKRLLNLLQLNARQSLKELSQQIHLSIDATKKRMDKMVKAGIIARYGIFINPKAMGYELVVDNKIRLAHITNESKNKLIAYLKEHPNCIELISISGDYDLTCVLIAKNTSDLNHLIYEIREKFKDIIAEWKSSFNLEVHKFEQYTQR